ncbi:endonuclease domain-containing protein [Novosphingobium lentum]|uniref:endonuclease domain-containing protein n=1 Tax=Novosphingobium lentum TaxID=145287 RepID=UPI00082D5375|nr:DUF559 domain-containing protein [Novosphingobium lentum]
MRKTLTVRDEAPSDQAPPAKRHAPAISESRLDSLHDTAREMRRNLTVAETRLWEHLSGGQLDGFKFRHKLVLGSAIVDFFCAEAQIAVEIDVGADAATIERRYRKLADLGLTVIRVGESDVMEVIDEVLEHVLGELQEVRARKAAARKPAVRRDGPRQTSGYKGSFR